MFLEIKGIRKSFGTGESHVDVLKGIDLDIEKGEFCVLLGPSGSGKSTLLNIIGGIDGGRFGKHYHSGRTSGGYERKEAFSLQKKAFGIYISDVQSDPEPDST